jgi:secernin
MCDTIGAVGAATAAGTVLFGKNSDRDYLEAQYLEWLPAARYEAGASLRLTYTTIGQARETYAVLLSRPHWIWGAEIGANEHGLVIGNEALLSKVEASLEEGIIGMDYLRLALERAKGVDEAIHTITTLLREHGQSGNCGFRKPNSYHNSFLLADFKGAKVLETVGRDWVVKPILGHYAISNAMTIETAFESSSATLEAQAVAAALHSKDTPFSFKSVLEDPARSVSGNFRRERAMALLAERSGRLQPADFFRVLRDHEEGPVIEGRPRPRICAHQRDNPTGQTTAAWVADLSPRKPVHWVTGTAAPCESLFKPVLFELGLPAHGPKPGAVEDGHSLWWRHEQLRRGLNAGGEEVRRAFIEERDALEGKFLAAMAQCPALTDAKAREEARRIVEACWSEALAFETRWHARCDLAAAPRAAQIPTPA